MIWESYSYWTKSQIRCQEPQSFRCQEFSPHNRRQDRLWTKWNWTRKWQVRTKLPLWQSIWIRKRPNLLLLPKGKTSNFKTQLSKSWRQRSLRCRKYWRSSRTKGKSCINTKLRKMKRSRGKWWWRGRTKKQSWSRSPYQPWIRAWKTSGREGRRTWTKNLSINSNCTRFIGTTCRCRRRKASKFNLWATWRRSEPKRSFTRLRTKSSSGKSSTILRFWRRPRKLKLNLRLMTSTTWSKSKKLRARPPMC